MLPDPLHPAVVHFPIVFMILLPLSAAGALWAIRRGTRPRIAWAVPTGMAVALALSTWVAVETGEGQEEKVERVVSETALDQHQEGAERFLVLSGLLLAVTAAGLIRGAPGRAARLGATAGALALTVLGVQVGHSGGELVYRHGAASAYTGGPAAATAVSQERTREDD